MNDKTGSSDGLADRTRVLRTDADRDNSAGVVDHSRVAALIAQDRGCSFWGFFFATPDPATSPGTHSGVREDGFRALMRATSGWEAVGREASDPKRWYDAEDAVNPLPEAPAPRAFHGKCRLSITRVNSVARPSLSRGEGRSVTVAKGRLEADGLAKYVAGSGHKLT
jgi:hypothetical protein